MGYERRHLSHEELRAQYKLVLARLERIVLAEHLSKVVDPSYEPSAEDAQTLKDAERAIVALEQDLELRLGEGVE